MVALVIGTFLLLVLTGYFLSQRETARLTSDLSLQQESVRVAYELLARDIREARYTPCGITTIPPGLNTGFLYATLTRPLEVVTAGSPLPAPFSGYDSGNLRRAAGTDALVVRYARSDTMVDATITGSNVVTVQGTSPFRPGDRVVVCNHRSAVSATVASVSGSTITLNIEAGALNQSSSRARLALLEERLWFVGRTDAGGCGNQGCGLYGAVPGQSPQEYVRGVSSLMMTPLCEDPTGVMPCPVVGGHSNRMAISIDDLTATINVKGSDTPVRITIQPIIGLRNPM